MKMTKAQRAALEKIKYDIYTILRKEFLIECIDSSETQGFLTNTLAIAVRGYVYGEHVGTFKIDDREFEIKAVYPDFRPQLPDEKINYIANEITEGKDLWEDGERRI